MALFSPTFRTWFPFTRMMLGVVWGFVLQVVVSIGRLGVVLCQLAQALATGKVSPRLFAQQVSTAGFSTLPIALLLNMFAGMVIAAQLGPEMVRQGAGGFIGALVSLAIVRELAGVFTGFSFIAMAGSAFTSELASMRLTNQVDALQMMGVTPMRYLQAPRIMAALMVLPMLTILSATVGVLAGGVMTQLLTNVSWSEYMHGVMTQVELKDLWVLMLRTGLFGFLIGVLCTDAGLATKGGSRELGEAVTRGVVASFIAMALANYAVSGVAYSPTK